jgi:osmoprotectant transport system permease protein
MDARSHPKASKPGISAPLLAFAAVGLAAAFALPFVRVRPNRIADGDPRLLIAVAPAAAVALAALWAAMGTVAALRRSATARSRAAAFLALCAGAAGLLAAGILSGRLAGASSVARVSLSSGFWLTMLSAYSAFVLATRGAQWRSRGLRGLLSASVPILLAAMLASGFLDPVSVMRELSVQKTVFLSEIATHAALAGSAVVMGGVLGIALGMLALRHGTLKRVVFFVLNIVQTIPSLALFGLLILPLAALSSRFPALHAWGISGIGRAPALIALTFYAMLPVTRNTHTALEGVPSALREAGAGMGMTRWQLLVRVEAPLALPLILAGVRTAAVQAVGNTVVTALIGAGGLGVFIFQGLGQFASDMILLGTLPVIAMAIVTDILMAGAVRVFTPRGLQRAEA